jgi:flagellar motility protein MotE (MotC chaperone)
MSTAAHLLTRYSIPSIILLKVAVISYIMIGDKKLISFGDKPLWGQTDKAVVPADAAAPVIAAAAVDPEESEAVAKKRRGFLDDLLNLPKISTEGMDKDEVGRYFTMLERKQSQIENRIHILSTREEQLKNLEKSVDEKIKKLEDEMIFFQQTIQKEKQLQGERLDKLVEFYQKMEAKKAAAVFEKLDKDLVVSLFNRFPQKQTTQILALMNPDRSVELSEYYGRIKSAKEYELLKEINVALRGQFEECKGLPKNVP